MTNQFVQENTHTNNVSGYKMADDEISLVDLWLVLARRKRLIAVVLLISVLAGLAYAFSKPAVYKYYTTMEIGSKVQDGKFVVVEDPAQLAARVETSYIPLALADIGGKDTSVDDKMYRLEVAKPKAGAIIEISGSGPLSEQAQYFKLLNAVVESIETDHEALLKILREEALTDRNKLLSAQDALNDRSKLIQNKLQRLEQLETVLKARIKTTNLLFDSSMKNRERAIKQAKDEAHAMTVMMIDNGLQNNRILLSDLEDRLYFGLAEEREALGEEISDIAREKKDISFDVDKLLLQEKTYRSTRVIVPPMRSSTPIGQGKKLIIALSIVLGLFVAIFAAFFMEFLAKVKEREIVTKQTKL